MWTEIVGKIRLAGTPLVNHWWNVTLYVTPRGLTTSAVPHGVQAFRMDFDFLDHRLDVATSDGATRAVSLEPQTVAHFYRAVMNAMDELRIPAHIWPVQVEVPDPVPFLEDDRAAYDPEWAERFWRVLVQADRVFGAFRARFIGKASPVHFFWGSFDLAATRFSGRTAPPHPGAPGVADRITREAYSHECSSAGFWPGGGMVEDAAFYAYAYPQPEGFAEARVRPGAAHYSRDVGEFLLPYEAVRTARDPDAALMAFLEDTYAAAADLGGWDRGALERTPERR